MQVYLRKLRIRSIWRSCDIVQWNRLTHMNQYILY